MKFYNTEYVSRLQRWSYYRSAEFGICFYGDRWSFY